MGHGSTYNGDYVVDVCGVFMDGIEFPGQCMLLPTDYHGGDVETDEWKKNILADDSYSHPFFITYINTSFFVVFLINVIARRVFRMWRRGKLSQVKSLKSFFTYLDLHGMKEPPSYARETGSPLDEDAEDEDYGREETDTQRQRLLNSYAQDPELAPPTPTSSSIEATSSAGKLGLGQTARLAAQFCMLWFLANYFAIACLQFTTVGSTTILTSTSGVWTLIFGALIRVERFTLRKALGVLASLIGVILISRVDLSSSSPNVPDDAITPDGGNDNNDPYSSKTPAEIALGDAMAALSAIVYGIYTIVMKKQVGDESRVNMQLFFGLVGLFNVFLLWPGFILLHVLDIERFSLPTENRIWVIILVHPPSPLSFLNRFSNGCIDQLHFISHIRYMLGLRNASHDPARSHSWSQSDHPVVSCWSNHSAGPVCRRVVLDWRDDCVCVIFDCESGE